MGEIYILRGIISNMMGEGESRTAFFETAQALRPFEDWVLENFVRHDLLTGNTELAAARLRKAALFTQGDPEIEALKEMADKKQKLEKAPDQMPFAIEFIDKRKIIWRYIFEQKIFDIKKRISISPSA